MKDSIDLNSAIRELGNMLEDARQNNNFTSASVLGYAIAHLNERKRSLREKRVIGENDEVEEVKC